MTTEVKISCSKEFGIWTVRVNGCFIVDFPYWNTTKAERDARRTVIKLAQALSYKNINSIIED